MKVIPVRDNLLIEILDEEASSKQLIMPGQTAQRARIARILEVGPDAHDYRVGDKILISWYMGLEIDLISWEKTIYNTTKIRMIKQDQVVGLIMED